MSRAAHSRARPLEGLVAAALCSLLLGCMEVVPTESTNLPRDRPGRLAVRARSSPSDANPRTSVWWIDAVFEPGLEGGVLRESGDTLVVEGQAVLPEYVSRRGYRRWRTEIPVPHAELHRRIISVRPPQMDEVEDPPPVLFTGIGSVSPDTVRWTPGTDLRLSLALPASRPDPVSERWGWHLAVEYGESTRFRLSRAGMPPEEIPVPHDFLPGSGPAFTATLSYFAYPPGWRVADGYEIRFAMSGELRWVIEVVPVTGQGGP